MGIRFCFSKKEWIYPLAILILGFFYYISYFNYGISFNDEGFFVDGAERVLRGQLPISDFISYPPASYFLLALLFKIFGINLLVSRYMEMAFLLMNGLMMYSIGKRLMPKTIALLPSFILIVFPGPWHKVFFTFGLLLPMVTLYWFLEKRSLQKVLTMGWAVGISAIFKLESGLYALLTVGIIIFLNHFWQDGNLVFHKKTFLSLFKDLSVFLLGFLSVILALLFYYFSQSSLRGLYDSLREIALAQASISGDYGQPSLLNAVTKFHIGSLSHLFFYLIVLLYLCLFVKVIFDFFVQKRRDFPPILPVLIMGCFSLTYAYAMFEKAHLLQSVAMAYLLFGYVTYAVIQKKGTKSKVIVILLVSLLGLYLLDNSRWSAHFYTGSISRLYAIEREGAKVISLQKAKIRLGKREADHIYGFVSFFEGKNSYLMSLRFEPMVNFLTGLENPTRFSILVPTYISEPSRQRQIIEEVEKHEIKYLLINGLLWTSQEGSGFKNYAPIIYEFIMKRYHLEKEIGNYLIFSRGSL